MDNHPLRLRMAAGMAFLPALCLASHLQAQALPEGGNIPPHAGASRAAATVRVIIVNPRAGKVFKQSGSTCVEVPNGGRVEPGCTLYFSPRTSSEYLLDSVFETVSKGGTPLDTTASVTPMTPTSITVTRKGGRTETVIATARKTLGSQLDALRVVFSKQYLFADTFDWVGSETVHLDNWRSLWNQGQWPVVWSDNPEKNSNSIQKDLVLRYDRTYIKETHDRQQTWDLEFVEVAPQVYPTLQRDEWPHHLTVARFLCSTDTGLPVALDNPATVTLDHPKGIISTRHGSPGAETLDGKRHALRFEVHDTDPLVHGNNGRRSELSLLYPAFNKPSDLTFSMDVLLPGAPSEAYQTDPLRADIFIQWHNPYKADPINDSAVSGLIYHAPPLAIKTNGNSYIISYIKKDANGGYAIQNHTVPAEQGTVSGDISRWVNWKVRIRWNTQYASNGLISIEKNGKPIFSTTGVNNVITDEWTPTLKIGNYSSWIADGACTVKKRVLYFDHVRVYPN